MDMTAAHALSTSLTQVLGTQTRRREVLLYNSGDVPVRLYFRNDLDWALELLPAGSASLGQPWSGMALSAATETGTGELRVSRSND